jgi:hydrogenase maturation protease
MNHVPTLVIGYGNRLRGDDGVGPAIADIVASWKIPGVRALAVSQLAPELVAELKDAKRVLFVDASANPITEPFTTYIVEPKESRGGLGHHSDPAHLLALTWDLEARYPDTWLLAINVRSLDLSDSITEIAYGNMQAALAWIRRWAKEGGTPCTKSD